MDPSVVGIDVIDDGMNNVNVNAAKSINDFGEAAESDPSIAIDGDTVVFFEGEACFTNAIVEAVMLRGPYEKCLVDFMHTAVSWDVYPGVTWDRDHVDTVVYCVNVYDHHDLCEYDGEGIFVVVVAAKEQDIPGAARDGSIVWCLVDCLVVECGFVCAPAHRMDQFVERFLDVVVEVVVTIGGGASQYDEKDEQDDEKDAHPSPARFGSGSTWPARG